MTVLIASSTIAWPCWPEWGARPPALAGHLFTKSVLSRMLDLDFRARRKGPECPRSRKDRRPPRAIPAPSERRHPSSPARSGRSSPESRKRSDPDGPLSRAPAPALRLSPAPSCVSLGAVTYSRLPAPKREAPKFISPPTNLWLPGGGRYRWASGTGFFGSGPTYSDWGRMSRLSETCSRTWAVQPAAREMPKVAGKKSVGRPTDCSTPAE